MDNNLDLITQEISSINDVIKLGTDLTHAWFRGHSKICNELQPKVFRNYGSVCSDNGMPVTDPVMIRSWIHSLERWYLVDFERFAPAFDSNIPESNDQISWLLLAQHHKLPTRLLDWSENIFVALYFASLEFNEDGELWVMDPYFLNIKSALTNGIQTFNSQNVQRLASAAILDFPEDANSQVFKYQPRLPIAFRPPMNSSRIIAQFSSFTIHPSPAIEEKGIIELLTDDDARNRKALCRYIIPKNKKEKIHRDLSALGIMRRSLFQDLDSLSDSIIETYSEIRPSIA